MNSRMFAASAAPIVGTDEQDRWRCSVMSADLQASERITDLIREHGSSVKGYVIGLTSDPQLADDIVQETMLRAWRNAHLLSADRGSVHGWLFKVARNLVIDRARAKQRRPAETDEASENKVAVCDHSDRVASS